MNQILQRLSFLMFVFVLFGTKHKAFGQTLVWQENFDSTALNTNMWTYDFGDGCERNLCGWGNAELQHYTSRTENVRVENGNLILEARRENYGTRSFTSGRIKTEGRVHIKYGTIEARIKIPNLANGLWPAFWTLGTIGPSWPSIGEMDIMEMGSQSARLAGLINRQVSSATHWSNNGVKDIRGSSTNASVDLNDDYHIYKLVWSQQSIKMYLDGTLILEQDITNNLNGTEEFHQPHFLLLNLAVGGAYTGLLNINDVTATMPAKMFVDYIKVYQNAGDQISFDRFNTTSGNFGVFAETAVKTDSLTLGSNATLNYWNNLTNISGAVPFEGNQVIAVRANPGNWFGMGIDNKYVNLSTHTSGSMKFHCKTSHQGQFKIGLRSADGESWVTFPASSSLYGLIRDGNWHEVSIPLSAFNTNPSIGNYIDFVAVKYAFMLVGDAPTSTADLYFDNIYFDKNAAVIPTLGSFSVPSKVLGQPAFTLTPPTSNSTGLFTYSSSNTAVATISGSTVTLVGAGSSTITATQSSSGIYGSASTTATLVVTMPTLTTAAPTPPARNAADVISLYSNAYSNISGIDWFPNWGQSTTATDVLIAGNQTRKYENLNYQGVQFSGSVNASSMSYLHLDIWTPNCNTFNVFLINTSPAITEQKVVLTPTFTGWNSYNIPLTDYNLIALNNINQMKFDCAPFGSSLVYLDNIYFWKTSNAAVISGFSMPNKVLGDLPFTISAPTSNSTGAFSYSSNNTNVATISGNVVTIVGVGTSTITATQAASGAYGAGTATADLVVSYPTPATAAPIPPARNNTDYLSIFSNAYNNVSGTDFNPNWGQTTIVSELNIQGNATKKYESFNYQGIQLANSIDVNNLQKIHIDIWTPNLTALDLYLINTSPALFEQKVTLTPNNTGWNSFDINLTQYPLVNLTNITQFKMIASPVGGLVYWDNLYFYRASSLSAPTISITQPSCLVTTGSITVTSPTQGLSFSINGTNYSNTNGVFSSLDPGSYSLTAKDASGNISPATSFTILPNNNQPSAVSAVTGIRNINGCDSLQSYIVSSSVLGSNYQWTVSGIGNRIVSGQGNDTVLLSLKAAGQISVTASNNCGSSSAFTFAIVKAVPTTPTVLTATGTNVCSYTQTAFAITGLRDTFRTKTIAGATGYYFETPAGATVQRLNDTTITLVFADTTTATTVKVYSLSSCDTSLAKSVSLTRTQLAAPTAITITPMVTNVCGARKYRYSAPALPAGALGYNWSFVGNLYSTATIDSGDVNSQKLVVIYTNNAAAATGDSVKLSYATGCGNSVVKASKLSNLALSKPGAPTAITIQAVAQNVCGARQYRYIAPNLPVATTTAGAATGWNWELTGSLAEYASIDSGDINSQKILVTYTVNTAAATGDSVKLFYSSGCGNTAVKASKLSNTALKTPSAPASITVQSIQTNVCGARKYRYIAPALPAATTTAGAATGYVWSFVGSLASTMTIDSGSLNSRILTVTFTSNAAAAAGDSVRVLYTSDCGNTARKASKLSNLVLNVPATPASVTIQTKADVCGSRKYRYTAPVLPVATTTAGAASGYLWTLPTGTVGSTGLLDSGSLSGRTIVIVYTSNAAATTDSIRVRYTSGCGNSGIKAQKLSNLAKTCLSGGTDIFSRTGHSTTLESQNGKIYPNPNQGSFIFEAQTIDAKSRFTFITIFDARGKAVYKSVAKIKQGIINEKIDCKNLKTGFYTLQYIVDNKVQNIRMIVE